MAFSMGKQARVAIAARLFPPDEDLALHHQVGDVLETDGALVQLAAVFGGDAIEHTGSVEGAHNVAGPFIALQKPAQQDAENYMRIHEATVFGDGSDAVGIAIRGQASIALLANHRLLQESDVRLDRLRIDAGKQRVQFLTNGDMLDAAHIENSRQNAAARTVHGVDGEFKFRLGNDVDVSEAADSSNVRLLQINFFDGRTISFRDCAGPEFVFHLFNDGGGVRPPTVPFTLSP